ncbi:MAG TPA: hypothetical protein VFP44_22520 [Usitatibacter sp.]|nr:hypothetical protein [Usitatibacter sp.]
MRHYSILEYAGFRWLKGALLLCAVAAAAYLWHDPPLKPYGGTWLGYTLGTIGALLIVWLLWYGVRKRRYRSTSSSVQGWLSAHVYLGTALVVVTTLHTGFELGWNVHTLAYVLMLAVVASGFYGVWIYVSVPKAITGNLGEDTLDGLVVQLGDIDRKLRGAGLSLPDELLVLANDSVNGTCLGGTLRRVVTGRDPSCPTAAAIRQWPDRAKRLTGESARAAKDVYGLLLQKDAVLERARRDLAFRARIEWWLYLHVPLAVALLAALTAHVVSVFIYW